MNKHFANTEMRRTGMLPELAKCVYSPKGLGWDGYKPLMRNRTSHDVLSPIGIIPATLSDGR